MGQKLKFWYLVTMVTLGACPSKANVMRFKLKDVLKKEESKWDKT
jgi:hypothetical protein